jgi:hypothetical protein
LPQPNTAAPAYTMPSIITLAKPFYQRHSGLRANAGILIRRFYHTDQAN